MALFDELKKKKPLTYNPVTGVQDDGTQSIFGGNGPGTAQGVAGADGKPAFDINTAIAQLLAPPAPVQDNTSANIKQLIESQRPRHLGMDGAEITADNPQGHNGGSPFGNGFFRDPGYANPGKPTQAEWDANHVNIQNTYNGHAVPGANLGGGNTTNSQILNDGRAAALLDQKAHIADNAATSGAQLTQAPDGSRTMTGQSGARDADGFRIPNTGSMHYVQPPASAPTGVGPSRATAHNDMNSGIPAGYMPDPANVWSNVTFLPNKMELPAGSATTPRPSPALAHNDVNGGGSLYTPRSTHSPVLPTPAPSPALAHNDITGLNASPFAAAADLIGPPAPVPDAAPVPQPVLPNSPANQPPSVISTGLDALAKFESAPDLAQQPAWLTPEIARQQAIQNHIDNERIAAEKQRAEVIGGMQRQRKFGPFADMNSLLR